MKSDKIIWTRDAICEYTGITKNMFYRLVRHGLPATVIEGIWCAHADNLDEFFRRGTARPPREIPEGVE